KILIRQNIKLNFDQTVHDLIYREGVYPTQGTRPIFTTIHQVIGTKLGKVIIEMILKELVVDSVEFKSKGNSIIVEYYGKNKKIHSISIHQELNLENLRKN